jgi:protocatechuate 3,4-dioxygenase beta subunit
MATPQRSAAREERRRVLRRIGLAGGAAVVAACGGNSTTGPSSTSAATTAAAAVSSGGTAGTACVVAPNETIGPYPSRTDMFRSDVRETRSGARFDLTITVVNTSGGCAPVNGAEVEIWHCDAAGDYSQYGSQTSATFLRGIQTTNGNGEVSFTTVYPGWYQGRATHIHIEVVIDGRSVKATQIAFPETVNNEVYRSGVYASRGVNPLANAADMIFADSLSAELVTPIGSPATGYTASYQLGIAL